MASPWLTWAGAWAQPPVRRGGGLSLPLENVLNEGHGGVCFPGAPAFLGVLPENQGFSTQKKWHRGKQKSLRRPTAGDLCVWGGKKGSQRQGSPAPGKNWAFSPPMGAGAQLQPISLHSKALRSRGELKALGCRKRESWS